MNKLLSSTGLAALSWVSLFCLTWLFILGEVPLSLGNMAFWLFFLFIAAMASAQQSATIPKVRR